MSIEDPDDIPTRKLQPLRRRPQFIFSDEVAPDDTAAPKAVDPAPARLRPARENPAVPLAPQPLADPDHVVTRRITAPRRSPGDDGSATPAPTEAGTTRDQALAVVPAGWLTVVAGPGSGQFRVVAVGMNAVGRDVENHIALSFGDDQISRREHCFVVYDDEARSFWLQHGGKGNVVRLNNAPVLAPTQMQHGDTLRIGRTQIRFTALCGPDFDWGGQ